MMLKGINSGVLLLVGLYLLGASSLAATPNLASMNWAANAPHNLADNPPNRSIVRTFMSEIDFKGRRPGYPPGICYDQFADLTNSGTLSLVIAENDGRFCLLSVINKTADGFQQYSIDLAHYAQGPEIADIGNNNHLELIVPTGFTEYEGAQYCVAEWPVIYSWNGSTYIDVSSQFKSFYDKRLESLKKEIKAAELQEDRWEQNSAQHKSEPSSASALTSTEKSATENGESGDNYTESVTSGAAFSAGVSSASGSLQSTESVSPPPPASQGLNCIKAEAAKIERFLGRSSDAGMSDAIKWANSNDPYDRMFAGDVLTDIATPEAIEYLRTLSHDSNSEVASSAKLSIEQVQQGPVNHTVDQSSIKSAVLLDR